MSFTSSSQRKHWTFCKQEDISNLRARVNRKYMLDYKRPEEVESDFLTSEEELAIVRCYEVRLRNFLCEFRPRRQPIPRQAKGVAIHLFKRFFTATSVMDFHPNEIIFTCVFLACKLSEFYISLDMFISCIKGSSLMLKNIILSQEMEILYRTNFQLNIHTPYRAIEGIMIDLKTRSNLKQPERLNDQIYQFLGNMWHTDVCLLYTPSQIALAAVMHAVTHARENIDQFVIEVLLKNPPKNKVDRVISCIKEIRTIVRDSVRSTGEELCELEKKLAKCRNPRNNPSSQMFKTRMMEYALEDSFKMEDQ